MPATTSSAKKVRFEGDGSDPRDELIVNLRQQLSAATPNADISNTAPDDVEKRVNIDIGKRLAEEKGSFLRSEIEAEIQKRLEEQPR